MRYDRNRRLAAATFVFASLLGTASKADRSVLIVLDASGSMNQKLADGATRLEAAKTAVATSLGKLAETQRVGLRVYGHQSGTEQRNCDDTALVTPMGPASAARGAIASALQPLKARGYTPITLSLEKAAGDIQAEPTEEKVILLVSDGRETCKGDPCAAAKALAAADASLVIHTIGFGVDQAARTQLQCIANVARGTYYDAENGNELGEKLGMATIKAKIQAPKPDPKPALGKLQISGLSGGAQEPKLLVSGTNTTPEWKGWMSGPGAELVPGVYNLQMDNGLWRGIQVNAGQTTVIQPAQLVLVGGNKKHKSTYVKLIDPETGEMVGELLMELWDRYALMPGRFHMQIGEFPPIENIELTAGKITILQVGQLNISSVKGQFFKVSTEDGVYSASAYTSELKTLPPGKYVLSGDGIEDQPFEVVAGKVMKIELK